MLLAKYKLKHGTISNTERNLENYNVQLTLKYPTVKSQFLIHMYW